MLKIISDSAPCWVTKSRINAGFCSRQMDGNVMMLFQNAQSRETEKSATTKEHSKVKNSYNFTVPS